MLVGRLTSGCSFVVDTAPAPGPAVSCSSTSPLLTSRVSLLAVWVASARSSAAEAPLGFHLAPGCHFPLGYRPRASHRWRSSCSLYLNAAQNGQLLNLPGEVTGGAISGPPQLLWLSLIPTQMLSSSAEAARRSIDTDLTHMVFIPSQRSYPRSRTMPLSAIKDPCHIHDTVARSGLDSGLSTVMT